MPTLLQNLRFSLRQLGRNPGMTITILLTVALGIGANTAIFTVDYATLLAPLFACDRALTIRYFRFNLMRGHETAGVPLTQADSDPLDYLESVCHRDGLAVSFHMERGDMQFVNNRFVLHSRTAFEDHDEPGLRRHFLRLWMRYSAS